MKGAAGPDQNSQCLTNFVLGIKNTDKLPISRGYSCVMFKSIKSNKKFIFLGGK